MNILQFLHLHEAFLLWLTGLSFITFATSSVFIPLLVIRIPSDYFTREEGCQPSSRVIGHPVMHGGLLFIKNLAGYILILAGILMLVLPGQGLLTIFIGIMLIDFPGKFRFEKWLITRRPVLNSINWLRKRAKCSPLVFHR